MEAQPAPVLAVRDREVELGMLLTLPGEALLAMCPDVQDGLDVLMGHPSVSTVLGYLEKDRVTREGPYADAPQEAALAHHVELGDAVGELRRVVVGDAAHTGTQPDSPGHCERLRDEQVRSGNVLPGAAVMLADPRLVVPKLVGQDQQLEIFIECLRVGAPRRVARHAEQAELHRWPPPAIS